jgi:hypothetical protein
MFTFNMFFFNIINIEISTQKSINMKRPLLALLITGMILCFAGYRVSAQTYHFQEGFASNAPPAGWLTTNLIWSTNHNNGLYTGDYSAKLKPNESFLMTKPLNTADVLQFFVKVRDTMVADNFHLMVEKSYDKNNWTELVRDPVNMKNDSVFQSCTVNINDGAPEIYIRFHATSVNGTASLGLCYIDDVSVTKKALSPSDATLADLTYNGTSVSNFTATTLLYQVEVPYFVEQALVAGTPNNPSAVLTITQPANLLGNQAERTGTVSVKSPDGTVTKDYKIVFTVSKYIFKVGFEKTGDGVMPLPGWTGGYTYTSTTIPMGNHGVFPGTAAMKFMRGQPDKIGFLITAKYTKADTLNFWLAVDQADGVEQLLIEKRVNGGVKIPIANITSSMMSADWQQFTYAIKETDSTEIILTPTLTSEGLTRIWIDDFSLTGKPRQVSVPEQPGLSRIEIGPNPASEFINIRTSGKQYQLVEIFSVTGSRVFSGPISDNAMVVNVKNFPAGIYFVSLSGSSGKEIRKFIRQ